MTETQKQWPGMQYAPVGPVVNRLLARYLRTQRKNMLRFFEERRLWALVDRMRQIRNSTQGMMAKNRMFQEVLNEYAKLAAVDGTVSEARDRRAGSNAEAPGAPSAPRG